MKANNNGSRPCTLNKKGAGEEVSRMQCVISKFKKLWTSFLASAECKEHLTNRGSYLVEVEKLSSEVFADLVRKEMPEKEGDQWKKARIVVNYEDENHDNEPKPVLAAKIVTTAKPLLPRLFRRQTWSLFKKRENVMLLLVHTGISSLDAAITLFDLANAYEESGMKPFAESVPWIGVGSANEPDVDTDSDGGRHASGEEFRPNLGNKVESVRYDAVTSTFILEVKDYELALALG